MQLNFRSGDLPEDGMVWLRRLQRLPDRRPRHVHVVVSAMAVMGCTSPGIAVFCGIRPGAGGSRSNQGHYRMGGVVGIRLGDEVVLCGRPGCVRRCSGGF